MLGQITVIGPVLIHEAEDFVSSIPVSHEIVILGQDGGVLEPGAVAGVGVHAHVFVKGKVTLQQTEFRRPQAAFKELDGVGVMIFDQMGSFGILLAAPTEIKGAQQGDVGPEVRRAVGRQPADKPLVVIEDPEQVLRKEFRS